MLWRAAGHPLVPRTELLRRAEEDVRALCAALRPGADASAAAAAVVAAAALAAREGRMDAAAALAAAAAAATAAVGNSGGGGLRAAALEGLCFFAWTHVRPDGGGVAGSSQLVSGGASAHTDAAAFLENEAGSIPAQLALECAKLAAAATLPKPSLRPLHASGEDDVSAMATDEADEGSGDGALAVMPAQPPPPEYEISATDLLRSADVLENGAGVISVPAVAGARALPPLGFPVWSQKWSACRAAHGALLPLLELHSVASQPALLAALSSRVVALAAAAFVHDAPTLGLGRDVLSTPLTLAEVRDAAAGLSFGIAAAPRDPADFAAHRHLLWLHADDEQAASRRASAASGGASSSQVAAALPSLVHGMWRSWHAASWGGTLESLPVAHLPRSRASRRAIQAGGTLDASQCHAARAWRATTGPPRAEHATVTALATALVGSGSGAASGVAARAVRMLQLRLAARALRLRRPSASQGAAAEWEALGALTAQALVAHVSATAVADRPALAAAANDLAAWCAYAADDDAPETEDQRGQRQRRFRMDGRRRSAEAAAALRERLSVTAGGIDHPPLQALMASVVGPLVEAVIFGAMVASASVDGSVSGVDAFGSVDAAAASLAAARRDRGARGTAWALLGLLRLHLLLPEGTPDPAAATATRLSHAAARLSNETRPTLAVLAWQRRTPAAPPPPRHAVAAAAAHARALAAEAHRLESRVVPRPKPPLWQPMVSEASRFRATLGSVERVTSLVLALSSHRPRSGPSQAHSPAEEDDEQGQQQRLAATATATATAQAQSRSGTSSQQRALAEARERAQARAEAAAWLAATDPWGGRLDVSFPGYRDATEPLQLAALELRRVHPKTLNPLSANPTP